MGKETLEIVIKKKYFNQILSGEKTEEYREVRPFWVARLIDKEYSRITFKNGYASNAPKAEFEFKGYEVRNITHEIFGDDEVNVFAIKIGERTDG